MNLVSCSVILTIRELNLFSVILYAHPLYSNKEESLSALTTTLPGHHFFHVSSSSIVLENALVFVLIVLFEKIEDFVGFKK